MGMPRIRGAIIALDGLLTEKVELDPRSWKVLAEEEGLGFDRRLEERVRGASERESLEILLQGREISPDEFQFMLDRKDCHHRRLLGEMPSDPPLSGLGRLMREMRQAGVALAAESARKDAPEILKALGVQDPIVVYPDAGHNGTAPEPFLLAAEEIRVDPAHCIVFSGNSVGIDGALLAGMLTVGVGSDLEGATPHVQYARLDATSWADVLTDLASHPSAPGAEPSSDPDWFIVDEDFDPERQHQMETIFTIGNGYMGTRGTFEEGYPGDWRATFVRGVFDDVPIYVTELANCPDWTEMELVLEGERVRLDAGRVLGYSRFLNLRNGVLTRRVKWESPMGKVIDIVSERLCSLHDRHLAAVRWKVTSENYSGPLEIRSGLPTGVDNLGHRHWNAVAQGFGDEGMWILARTRSTGIQLAIAADLSISTSSQAAEVAEPEQWDTQGHPSMVARREINAGESLIAAKTTWTYTGRDSTNPLGDAVEARGNSDGDFPDMVQRSSSEWGKRWTTSDVRIDGDPEIQRAVRHNLFQLVIAAPHNDHEASIGARTLSGFMYRGHIFWDTEIFILPFLCFTDPVSARHALEYRYARLPAARRNASRGGSRGAQFPWESAETGTEVTPSMLPDPEDPRKWIPIWTGDTELHITSDIAYATTRYWQATGDDGFMAEKGVDIVLGGAQFWGSRVEKGDDGAFHIRGITGPDEYHDRVDDNFYTNYLVAWHFRQAIRLMEWLRERDPSRLREVAAHWGIVGEDVSSWAAMSEGLALPDPSMRATEQFEGYFDLRDMIMADLGDRSRSAQEILGIEGVRRSQIIKQPDVLMLHFMFPDEFGDESLRRNWDYYERRTDTDYGSSLGAAVHAVLSCRLALPDLAYRYFRRAALVDLEDFHGNSHMGFHGASAGGVWQALVLGFAGLSTKDERLGVEPRLPSKWQGLHFSVLYRGGLHHFDLAPDDSGTQ